MRTALLLLALMLGLAVAPYPQAPAHASCAAPSLEGGRIVLERGRIATVEGRGFVDGCRDSMSCPAFGCEDCAYDDPPAEPYQDLTLRLRQGAREWVLTTADAGAEEDRRLGQVTWKFALPDGVRPGPATLIPDRTDPVPVRIR